MVGFPNLHPKCWSFWVGKPMVSVGETHHFSGNPHIYITYHTNILTTTTIPSPWHILPYFTLQYMASPTHWCAPPHSNSENHKIQRRFARFPGARQLELDHWYLEERLNFSRVVFWPRKLVVIQWSLSKSVFSTSNTMKTSDIKARWWHLK